MDGPYSFFCHCHKRIPNAFGTRQEGYTAPSCHAALWYRIATVASVIDLYCTPLMDAAFINCKQWGHLIL